jgi:multimeric flavodoxin WrbA
MQPLYKKLKRYDAIIVVSPVYFGSIPAQLKAVVDRCQAVWVENFILKKRKTASKRKGMLILTSGCNNKNFFRNSEEIIRIFFAVLGVKLFKKLYVPNLEKRRDILKRTDALNKAFEYGISLTG